MLVYVIDDEKFILKLLERSLIHDSHEVEVFSSGTEFIGKYRNLKRPDVIITDIVMPGHSGIEVFQDVLDYHKNDKDHPYIIFMSAYDQTGVLSRYINQQDVWFIPKPFGIMELRSVFSEIYASKKRNKSGAYPATESRKIPERQSTRP